MSNIKVKGYRLMVIGWLAFLTLACNPDASWTTKDVSIQISPYTVSAGYVECAFTPNEDAYYLVACEPARPGVNPQDNPKQFMTLALDSANTEYIQWRYDLLKAGEFQIAPFASHCLQYGKIDKFFTNLKPETDYWIYAFVVNPEKIQPAGKLFLQTVTTKKTSVVDVHFDYRVRGYWDYIYPLNPDGKIVNKFPYLASTVDSATLTDVWGGISPEDYFNDLFITISKSHDESSIHYGVTVVYNDGWSSTATFEEGHTYYTAIVSYDGFIGNNVIYKFTWTGEDFEAYFTDEDNIAIYREDE